MSRKPARTTPAILGLLALTATAFATDTDGDGLEDGFESTFGTSPSAADSDGDGLSDFVELYSIGTDPNLFDTDGDGVVDGSDVDPLDPGTDLDGGAVATFSNQPTSTGYALAGTTPYDGVGVMVHDGRLTYSLSVAGAKGVKLPFDLDLHYDSSRSYDGFVGHNWTCILDATAVIQGNGDVTLCLPPRGQETWTANGPTYLPPSGSTKTLVIETGVLVWYEPNGFAWQFANGVIDKVQDKHGNAIDYAWSGGIPTSAIDSRGETHTFAF